MRLALEVGPRRGNVPTWACWVFVTYVNAHEISSRDKLSEKWSFNSSSWWEEIQVFQVTACEFMTG